MLIKKNPRFAPRSLPSRLSSLPLVVVLATLFLSGCALDRMSQRSPAWADTLRSSSTQTPAAASEITAEETLSPASPAPLAPVEKEFIHTGTGRHVNLGGPRNIADARAQADGQIKLNFQNANLIEVVKVILTDMVGVNYIIDPGLQGLVSMQTARPIRKEDLIPTLEMLLRMNGAALVDDNGTYRVVPRAKALVEAQSPQLGDSAMALPGGFTVKIIPLKYISALEMAEILTPFVADNNQILRVDSGRNLLIVGAASGQMERLLDMVEIFDVDRMAGMSVGLFSPDFVDAKTLADDLEQLLDDPERGLMPGLVRFIVVPRLNGLIVVTSKPEHLTQVRAWVQRLDKNFGDASQRLFVYRVQNGKAAQLAETLDKLFSKDNQSKQEERVRLAPGLRKATIGEKPAEAQADAKTPPPGAIVSGQENGLTITPDSPIQIIADEANNALLILAKGTDYHQILGALKQLDVSPMQVLIEVTIAEVTLTDTLSYGVEWFFRNNFGSKTGVGTLDLGALGLPNQLTGFSYALQASGGTVQAVLAALATETNLSVIQSPSLLVLNNEEATIQVGEEVPVKVQAQASIAGSNIVDSIEYRETGVLLKVKPRINAGGLVIMEVEQEASQVPSTTDEETLTPRIKQRKISSTVAVNSGDTIILGGLIQDNRDRSESGVPYLHTVPVLGALFGSKADNQGRTELIILITPRAVQNSTAAMQVTDAFRRRLQQLIPERPPTATEAVLGK